MKRQIVSFLVLVIVLEESDWSDTKDAVRASSMYAWRAFTNLANSSKNNAVEFGDRTWNKDKKFGGRRALVEEAQEVKAVFFNSSTGRNDSGAIQWVALFPARTCKETSTMAMWIRLSPLIVRTKEPVR